MKKIQTSVGDEPGADGPLRGEEGRDSNMSCVKVSKVCRHTVLTQKEGRSKQSWGSLNATLALEMLARNTTEEVCGF